MSTGRILVALAAIGLCGIGKPLDKAATPPKEKQGYFIFGAAPANFKIQVYPGWVTSDGRFRLNTFANAIYNSAPDDGYVVGSGKAGSVVAITRVYDLTQGFIVHKNFMPCADGETLVFTIVGGKTIYLADLEYVFSDNGLTVNQSQNLDAARKYLEANYPKIAQTVEQGDFNLRKTTFPCQQTLYVPVYVHR